MTPKFWEQAAATNRTSNSVDGHRAFPWCDDCNGLRLPVSQELALLGCKDDES